MVFKTVEPPDNLPCGILGADGVERRLLDLTDEIWEAAGTLRDLVGEFGEQLSSSSKRDGRVVSFDSWVCP